MQNKYGDKINQLLSKMTLDEKVGQLRQCGPSLAGAFSVSLEELLNMVYDGKMSGEELKKLLSEAKPDYHEEDLRAGRIGSYNGIAGAETLNALQRIAVEETRLGIPLLFGFDVLHGYRTITPIPLAESCAWDPELWEKTAIISAREASSAGIHMTYAPMVDVSRDARWGRVAEGAGEDPYLVSCFGAAKVRGFQGDDLNRPDVLAACAKHFAGYGAAEAGRDYNRVDMSMARFHEEILPPFAACIRAGVRGIMPAFNDLNGVPCTADRWLLTELLRETLGFDGMTISDANAIAELVDHGLATDREDAARLAIEAGVDMDMTSDVYHENIAGLVSRGTLPESLLDRAVSRILQIKYELGLFDNPYRTTVQREGESILLPQYREVAGEAAEKSMVLLKNEGILPLPEEARLCLVGCLLASRGEMTGTWAISARDEDCVSVLDACEGRNIPYAYASGADSGELEKAVADSDVILVGMGELKSQSGEGASRADLSIPTQQMAVLDQLLAFGKPVVVVLFNGRPLAIPELREKAPCVLEAWHPGVEAGNAIVRLLFGEVNPSGRLTMTFPHSAGQCPAYYAHIRTGRPAGKSRFTSKYLDVPVEPVYPFGYGLSYTTFAYSDMRCTVSDQDLLIKVVVGNTGNVDGDEIVQCYFSAPATSRVRPTRQLVAFQRVSLQAKEHKTVSLEIPRRQLGYHDRGMNYRECSGSILFTIGDAMHDRIHLEIDL